MSFAVATVALLLDLLVAPSFALDPDGDGWDEAVDCDENSTAVNPAAAEDGTDDVDEDCDGSVLVHRVYVASMNNQIGNDFTLGGGVTQISTPDDLLRFSAGPWAMIALKYPLPFLNGRLTVTLRVTGSTMTPSCAVDVASTSMARTSVAFTGAGTHTLAFPGVQPGDDVTTLEVSCPGAGSMDLDWLTVQNGPYAYGPLNDVGASFETMGLPGMGRQSVVRASHSATGGIGALMFVGSDVGGMGWSEDGLVWNTANGRATEWVHEGHYGVWEIWAQDEGSLVDQDVVVLTGFKDDADDGGLWYTEHLASATQSWTKVTTAEGDLGASKHIDDCPAGLGYKPIGSGQLIVNHPADTTASRFLVASQDPETFGLWTWTKGSAPTRAVFSNSLPSDALPSALAIDAAGDWLLVGYRVIASNGSEHGALYLCQSDFEDPLSSCELVSSELDEAWAGDVRDIEADPLMPGRFYVADGGRRWDGTSACTTSESTVYVVDVALGPSWPPAFVTIEDTDDAVDDVPDWANGATEYYALYACFDNNAVGAASYGELVPPRGTASEGYELSSIAVDPSGDYLFAFYPLYESRARDYGCVRTFRIPTADVSPGTTPWLPFQGWEYQKNYYTSEGAGHDYHTKERRAAVSVEGTSAPYDAFQIADPMLEAWAGAGTHDAAFVSGAGEETDLLLGGNFLWRVLPASLARAYGWNTANTDTTLTDMDQVVWELAWDGEGAVLQDATSKEIAVCPGCVQASGGMVDLVLAAGMGDYKMARLYGKPSSGSRPAADRSCEPHMLQSTGNDVSIWPGDGVAPPQAWMVVSPASDDVTDPGRKRGVLFLDDVATDEWCWDAVASGGLAVSNFIFDGWTSPTSKLPDGLWELHCQDESDIAYWEGTPAEWWDACDQDAAGDPWNMGEGGIGQVVAVDAFGDGVAMMAAAPGKLTSLHSNAVAGEGLWLATYLGADGIQYDQVTGYPTAGLTYGTSTCSHAEYFAYPSQVDLVVDPTSDPTGTVRVYLSSRHADCGVARVDVDVTTLVGTWTAVDLATPCTLTRAQLRGVSVSRDGRWLMAYGGPTASAYEIAGVCAVDTWSANATHKAIDGTVLDIELHALMPHPHLDDTFYVGGIAVKGTTSRAPGLFALQRRYRPDTGTWGWAFRAISGDDLEHRTVMDVDWGMGASAAGTLQNLYVTAAGGGFWDATLQAE